jgi:hypothetical protein
MHKYRHVKLARQAMAFWQSYDAFARTEPAAWEGFYGPPVMVMVGSWDG